MGESPDLAAAKRLIDELKGQGFVFARMGDGEDAPLWGVRASAEFFDTLLVNGVAQGCNATRMRQPPEAAVDAAALVVASVEGDAVTVLRTVCSWALTSEQ